MQSTRFLAANMLRQQAVLRSTRAVPMAMRIQPVTRSIAMQATPRMRMQATKQMRMPVPKEEQSGHTVSQRLRKLRQVPPELVPLGVVLAVALFAAAYASINTFFRDKTLRLSRQGPETKGGH